ncbi:PREDICTED: uncharacterized protein LOC107187947 [Dufourea novaeangliae]|uniref:Uncharacterized protein n=1 Tax=Dufourea novaeangliae TaxID=178035 RepID=A0A154PD72_DUFNO|nr:PREDICTED: uncharacterized protein LOC107187947 [Dufourea novaeangliae]KZC09802.1 hypothetical protein WN55_00448 [Dufourea novaeangliae]
MAAATGKKVDVKNGQKDQSENQGTAGEGDAPTKKPVAARPVGKRWHKFRALTPNTAILRGSYAMTDPHFKYRSRGRQAAPASVVAIVYGRLFEPKEWTKEYVDQVLENGDKVYRTSAMKNHVKDDEYMKARLIHPEFYISNYKILVCVEETGIYGNLFSETVGCPDFADGLRKFFQSSDSGIITAQGTSMAMWRHPDVGFVYFDPAPCDEDGVHNPAGVACVMRFKCMNDLRDHFLKSMDQRYDSRYCIDKVTVLRVSEVGRGYVDRNPSSSRLAVDKSVLRAINPVDIDENKMDCTKPVPKGDKVKTTTTAKIHREPLSITISNYSIDKKFATDPLVDQNQFDTGYSYENMHVNVPSTFRELPGYMALLHGLTHEGSEVYKGKGAQNVANCVMAIAMKKVHPVKTWLRPKLDEILSLGDTLYADVKSEKPMMKSMTASDLFDVKIQVEDRKLVIDVDLITVTGTVSSKIPTVLNLKQALEEFFLVNTEGVIESSSMSVAIWSQDDCYYMFDPRQCDLNGLRIREEKGKGKNEEEKKKGNCCVMRFPKTEPLATLFWKDLEQSKKNDRFTIRHITILDDVPGTRPWYDFQPGTAGETWVLQGTISNEEEEFEDESRGNQGLAMPVVALIAAKETQPTKWTSETIDTVIHEGDAYYNWCNPATDIDEEEQKYFFVPNLKKNLYYKNRKVKIDVEEGTVIGKLSAADNSDILNMEKALANFFTDHQYGIVDVKNISVAVWKMEEDVKEKEEIVQQTVYYCFDPNPRNNRGLSELDEEESLGTACVIKTLSIPVLAKLIQANAEKEEEEITDEFAIHDMKSIQIGNEMTEEEIEADKLIPVKPDLHNYISTGENGAILMGSFNQANEVMFKRQTRDKQQAASALATLAMTKLYNPHLWYREVVDDILKIGDKIAQENLENLPEDTMEEEETPRNYLLPDEITEEFTVGVNKMYVELEAENATGRMGELEGVLENFFETNVMGIFRQENIIMPIWREADVYFTMDPKGRDSRGEPREKDGAAVVMWFTDVPSLIAAIQQVATGDDFVIDSVTLSNAYETRVAEEERPTKPTSGEDPWYHFPKMTEGVWHISGTVKMDDNRFQEDNRNKQTAAIAVMAIVFAKVYEPRYWTQAVLDEVIVTGDKLHSKCVERLGEGAIPRINEIMTEFFLSTRRINLTIKDCVEAGSLTAKPPKVQGLKDGIDKFFSRYSSGALTVSGNRNISIWKFDNFYYTLIPDWVGPTGDVSSLAPKVLRVANMEILVGYLIDFLGTESDYEMIVIKVVNWNKFPPWKFDPSAAVRPSNLPPLNAYRRVQGEARAILRGSYHQGDEIFPESFRNKQTAANCVVAIGMSVVKNPITWTKKTMDEVLVIGANVHRLTEKAKPTIVRIKPKDIIRVFYVGVNILTADIEAKTVTGIVAIPPPQPEDKKKKKKRGGGRRAKGGRRSKKARGPTRVRPPPPPPILLEKGIQKFFENNRAGVVVTDRGAVAIWKDMGIYFMYDPRARSDQGLPDFYGTSCVMWFACIEPMYQVLFANIDDQEKYGRYQICRVIIKTANIEPLPCPAGFRPYFDCVSPPIPVTHGNRNTTLDVETVTEYNFVDEELSVLRGTLHMNHRTWSTISRSYQSTAIAAVAIVVGLLHVPSTWTPELVDAILKYGDLLHLDSVRAARPGSRNLSPSELLTVFIVGDFRATIHVHNHTTAGLLHTFDLSESLAMFFRSNCAGILHTTNMAVAVMQHYGKFYLFDPCARDDQGRPNFDGAACVMKCESIMKMAKVFVANSNLKTPNVYTLNAVNVLSLFFFSDAKTGCPPKCEQ